MYQNCKCSVFIVFWSNWILSQKVSCHSWQGPMWVEIYTEFYFTTMFCCLFKRNHAAVAIINYVWMLVFRVLHPSYNIGLNIGVVTAIIKSSIRNLEWGCFQCHFPLSKIMREVLSDLKQEQRAFSVADSILVSTQKVFNLTSLWSVIGVNFSIMWAFACIGTLFKGIINSPCSFKVSFRSTLKLINKAGLIWWSK